MVTKRKMRTKQFDAVKLRCAVEKIPNRWAVALRGSHSRCASTRFSDIDIYVFTDTLNNNEEAQIVRSLGSTCPELSVCCNPYSCVSAPVAIKANHWLSIPSLRFLMGDKQLLEDNVSSAIVDLLGYDWKTLSSIYADDPYRSQTRFDKTSDHYFDLKYGHGGLIDYQALEIRALYDGKKSISSGAKISELFEGRLIQRKLDRIRSFLHLNFEETVEDYRHLLSMEGKNRVFSEVEESTAKIGSFLYA